MAENNHRRDASASRRALSGLLREPLVHFLLLGGVLFGGYALLERNRSAELSPREIRLSVDDLAQLVLVFQSQWRRPPTQEEFNALVEDRVRLDILYREALSLGLDKDDTIVKRRMAQKMQFLAEDLAAAKEPSTEELRAWFAQNTELFALPERLSFRHLYFSTDKRGEKAKDDAAKALQELSGEPQISERAASLGDPFMFQDYYGERTPQAVALEFGPEFSVAVAKLRQGGWQGPVKSGYGWHLVFLERVVAGRVPAFEEVEEEVKTAWLGQQKDDAWRRAYEDMRAKYTVLLPVPVDDVAGAAANAAPLPQLTAPNGEAAR